MSSAYKLTIPEDFPLSDEDPMESDLELTPTPRKPPTEWWLCDDLLEMVGKVLPGVRKRLTIQYWHDITGQKDVNILEKYGNHACNANESREIEWIINRRMTLKTIGSIPSKSTQVLNWGVGCAPGGIGRMCQRISPPPYEIPRITSYPNSKTKKNKCGVCRRLGHNKRNCPHARKQLRQMRYDKLTNPSAPTPSSNLVVPVHKS